jgi:hypothetical protein
VRERQLNHEKEKFVPDEVSISGKDVREVQSRHALWKPSPVPDDVSINGKEVREEQPYHALWKVVPDEVLISGKEVREEQSRHAAWKFVTLPNALLAADPLSTK